MSVGVCVINRNGIALAADSAGTFNGNEMFYNSMNKVFSLSKHNVVGAIIYGNLSIYNVSVEQIIKEFSLYMDSNTEINDFFEILPLFQEFIKINNTYYKFDKAEIGYCQDWIKRLSVEWGNKIKNIIDSPNFETEANKVISELGNIVTSSIKIDGYDISKYINSQYIEFYDKIINIVVPEIKNHIDIKNQLWDYICLFFNLSLKDEIKSRTGLFFSGYGKNDAFPKYIEIELYTVINGQAKFRISNIFEEENNQGQIKPLAQDDVILTFCRGISNTFINYIPQKVGELISQKIDDLPNSFSNDQKNDLRETLLNCKSELADAISAQIQNNNVNPIFKSVDLLPLSEMAFLAENLVNITSLKRLYSLDGRQQTVGGPTDVAIISKGDGFVWVKNKTL